MDVEALQARVRDRIDAELPLLPGSRVVLAASGGADSTALVALLCEGRLIDPERAVIAHFNHALRPDEEAALDRDAVSALAGRYGLRVRTGTWTEPHAGEAAARRARYAFLQRVALEHRAVAIVTGHTADDQVETVLMHAMRGAGLHGLSGMLVDAPLAGCTTLRIWRPLLAVERNETRAYCIARGLAFTDDTTNDDRRLLRNRVRLELLPQLSEHAPHLRETLLEVAAYARTAAASLDAIAATAIDGADDVPPGAVALSRASLAAMPRDAVPHAFRLALVRLSGDARDVERKHYAIMERAVRARTGSNFALPRGVTLTVDSTRLILSSRPLESVQVDAIEHPLPFAARAGAWHLRIVAAAETPMVDGGIDLRLPEGAVVRGRRPGDRVRTHAGSKKLGDWYIDRKIPRRERDAAPVIVYGNQVFWTPWGALGELSGGGAWRISWERAAAGAQIGALDAVESVPV